MTHSHLEWTLSHQIEADGLPEPEREFKFDPIRRWKADFCWPDHKVLAECEGDTWGGKGRHVRGKGFEADCEKYNAAAMAGWIVLRFTESMIEDGRAVAIIKKALEGVEHELDEKAT